MVCHTILAGDWSFAYECEGRHILASGAVLPGDKRHSKCFDKAFKDFTELYQPGDARRVVSES
eukprot:5684191-Lingulodinium_polyedra.AAC.1